MKRIIKKKSPPVIERKLFLNGKEIRAFYSYWELLEAAELILKGEGLPYDDSIDELKITLPGNLLIQVNVEDLDENGKLDF